MSTGTQSWTEYGLRGLDGHVMQVGVILDQGLLEWHLANSTPASTLMGRTVTASTWLPVP